MAPEPLIQTCQSSKSVAVSVLKKRCGARLKMLQAQMGSDSIVHLLTLPMFKEYALVFGIWVYSLQLRTIGYFSNT
ncbi:hypothetical protein VRB67_12105 [Pseudomonas trivialis]|uniref:hypothetical protein n=1 Tax=Pseudomonas trivialis TaxID=200450 RepID=UPI0030CFDC99